MNFISTSRSKKFLLIISSFLVYLILMWLLSKIVGKEIVASVTGAVIALVGVAISNYNTKMNNILISDKKAEQEEESRKKNLKQGIYVIVVEQINKLENSLKDMFLKTTADNTSNQINEFKNYIGKFQLVCSPQLRLLIINFSEKAELIFYEQYCDFKILEDLHKQYLKGESVLKFYKKQSDILIESAMQLKSQSLKIFSERQTQIIGEDPSKAIELVHQLQESKEILIRATKDTQEAEEKLNIILNQRQILVNDLSSKYIFAISELKVMKESLIHELSKDLGFNI